MKNKMRITFLLSFFLAVVFSSCVYTQVEGNGNVVKEDRDVPSFTGLDVEDGIDVILSQDNSHHVTVEADENLLEILKTEVSGGVLKIYLEKNVWNRKTLKAYVTVKELSSISVSGGGDVVAEQVINANELEIDLSGGGDLDIRTRGESLKMEISGGGDAEMEVDARTMKYNLSGGGDLELNFEGKTLAGSISGGGDAEIALSNKLDLMKLDISGGGDLELSGSATDMNFSISGGGDAEIDAMEESGTINIDVGGGGNIEMSANVNALSLQISGGGNAQLAGSASSLKANCKSGSDLYAEELKVEDADVTLSGGGDAKIHVTGTLNVSASGGGHVYVTGNPHIKEGNFTGGSKLHSE